MFDRLKKSLSEKDKGFTLIELLVVVVIIGILAAIAIPTFLGQKEKATEAGVKSDLKNASTYMETYAVDHGNYTGADTTALAGYGYRPTTGNTLTIKSASATGYCLEDVNSGNTSAVYHLSSTDGAVATGACPASS